ncbi:phage portal protein [Paenibacillus lactis]|uniref:phage portal protein n=1 Tax=Paenibacillus lactis TaxID=228574 RepID=UPI00203F142E|nr:phage portal protein [Paenibacillus lactis]MCM3492853.1 phage portal protein [Paenibacillus lactis]
MSEKRSFFQMIFGTSRQPPKQQTYMQMLNSTPNFVDFSGEAYDSDTVRSTVDAFARNVGKLKAKHIRRVNGKIQDANSDIEWLLQVRPNRFMNAYIFYYRLATQFLMSNNVFVWIRRYPGNNKIEGFYPLVSSSVDLLEYNGSMVVRFRFYDGKEYTAPYEDIIHIRRFFFKNDMFGESNSKALKPILNLISVTNQGIANAVKTSALLRGILKFTAMLKPEDMKKQTDQFTQDYLTASNNGGIAATDSKAEYQELKSDPKMIDDKQMSAMENKVYSYFGTNGKIVQSDYSEGEWGAYYESMIEPFALQMGLEFTAKIFSDRAQGHGNEILFEANRLQYASNDTKVKIIETLVDRGMMSINQGLEVFNLPPIENGDKRIMSLNFIDADKANEYQLGKTKAPPEGGEGE